MLQRIQLLHSTSVAAYSTPMLYAFYVLITAGIIQTGSVLKVGDWVHEWVPMGIISFKKYKEKSKTATKFRA